MVYTLLNSFAVEQELKYHRPIYNEILKNLNPHIYKEVRYSYSIDFFVKSTYRFYDTNNYLIFKLHIYSIYNDNKRFFIDIEFTYSYNSLYYWTQINNPCLKIDWTTFNSQKIKSNLLLINKFINNNLKKNYYFNQNDLITNQILFYYLLN